MIQCNINWFVIKTRRPGNLIFFHHIGIYLLEHKGVLIFMSEVQGGFLILCYRHNVHESLERNTKSVLSVYFFLGVSALAQWPPGPFISCIGNIILLDLHMKGQYSFRNKKKIYFFISKNKNDDQNFW